MNTKVTGVFVAAAALIGAATMLAQAQDTTLSPRPCIGDGVLPASPSWDTVDHKGDSPDFWCCWAKVSGSLVTGEDVRYWAGTNPPKARTSLDDFGGKTDIPCTTVIPP
jgi:hypothetical protein